ncbi:hypothetical protein KL921_003117 [Ogataea angusta]|nr:hypothetical protein KL921_003117 [Ogataea angusta]
MLRLLWLGLSDCLNTNWVLLTRTTCSSIILTGPRRSFLFVALATCASSKREIHGTRRPVKVCGGSLLSSISALTADDQRLPLPFSETIVAHMRHRRDFRLLPWHATIIMRIFCTLLGGFSAFEHCYHGCYLLCATPICSSCHCHGAALILRNSCATHRQALLPQFSGHSSIHRDSAIFAAVLPAPMASAR